MEGFDKKRVCGDYIYLNKACPKGPFPVPHIDILVNSTSVNQLLSFLNAYFSYNQIKMHKLDKIKCSFVSE